ncbi:hypothetical protein [Tropicibacter naphthalenivorans]|nr:hypothetical protein [Tropicibacter naphthalenivorans]
MALCASPVWALSCRPPDPVQAFIKADQDSAEWVVAKGQFLVFERDLPKGAAVIPGTFTGLSLTSRGFTEPFDTPVQIEISCAGPWCGAVRPDVTYIAFLRKEDASHRAFAKPCPVWLFTNPGREEEQMLTACLRGTCP